VALNTKTNPLNRIFVVTKEIGRDVWHLMPAAALVFVNVLPADVLVFTQATIQPFVFSIGHNIIDTPISVSYPFKPGAVLGVISTAYSSTVAQTDNTPFITASGTRVRPGIIAANFLPLGTRVRIGASTYAVEDRMNVRYNDKYRIDIWMASTERAKAYGAKPVLIEIVSLPIN
jgi:3D (Asp-Asp-Asp) domain-containing protein